MSSYTHYGQDLNAANLQVACYQAIQGRPQVPRPLYPMAGSQWLEELIVALKDHPLGEELAITLGELLDTASPADLEVLAKVAASKPHYFKPAALVNAFLASERAPATARAALARAVSRQIIMGLAQPTEALRSFHTDPALREALAPAWVVHDHPWAMQEIRNWFGSNTQQDRDLLLSIVSSLTRGELLALVDELRGVGGTSPSAATAQFSAYAAEQADSEYFKGLGDHVRWRDS